ncbi:unnamed protein product, partial [Closterium sp. Yama58-4]
MAQVTLNDDDWPAIKEMKASLTFSGWDTWVQGNVCTAMTGITCDSSGYVTRIKVLDCSGSLPAAIGDLLHLDYLFCVSDNLTGPLPNSISKLINLKTLLLPSTGISGSIPKELGSLISLEYLNLYGTSIEGFIPTSIGSLNALKILNLAYTGLSGSLPEEIGGCSALSMLSLSSTPISGSLPTTLSKLVSLTQFDCQKCALSGELPSTMSSLGTLQYLNLNMNQLSGHLLKALEGLTSLHTLKLSNNALSGSLPRGISRLTALTWAELSSNELSGTIPEGIGALTNVQQLSLDNNQLSGPLPSTISDLVRLKELYLSFNEFFASLPSEISGLTDLQILVMSNCELLGSLPSELGMLPSLGFLDLSFNSLSGSLPLYLAKLTGLDTLDLSHNQLSGSIPKDLLPTNLRRLDLCCNELSGTIPNTIGGLLQLEHLDLSSNRFSGSIPTEMTDLIQLTLLNLRSNQLTGAVLQPIPRNMQHYQLDNNYFSSAFPSQPPCSPGTIITTRSNCAVAKDGSLAPTFSCPEGLKDAQRRVEVCRAFCGLSSESLPCGGHGVCFFDGPNRVPTCACDSGYTNGGVPGSCVPDDGSLPFINTTSDSSPPTTLSLSGSASLLPSASILLSPAQPTNWGAAFLPQPIRLFSFALLSSSSCGRSLPFSPSFAFTIDAPSSSSANAFASLAFIVSATGAVAGGSSSSSSSGSYLPESERSIAVVFDAAPASASKPNGIVSIQVKTSTSSSGSSSSGFTPIATTTAPTPLNDGSPKYAWIDYRPSSSSAAAAAPAAATAVTATAAAATGSLRVFLSSRPSPRPSKAVLSARISLCALLSPTESASAFFLGFAAASDNPPLELTLLQWSIAAGLQSVPVDSAFPLGLTLSGDSLSPPHVNPFFRYASAGVLPLRPKGDMLRKLFGITCKSGVPMDTRKKAFQISGFERTSFYGWFGLLLAVQRQPVVVHIEASADSFKQYDGLPSRASLCPCLSLSLSSFLSLHISASVCLCAPASHPRSRQLSKYQDPACFTYNLNHVVLLVGYRLVGTDDTAPHMAPPFWIIRNSWGADWGDGGHMRMDIQGGDGVCGINSLPGLYPVVKSPRDPCNTQARRGALGPVLNPCGNFTCRVQGTTNRCDCTDPRFVEALNADGSRTCAYVDVCRASFRNPCAVGTCVNDGAGSYSCVCPPGFRQGTTIDGTFSCAPGDTDGTYTVLSLGLTCAAIHPVYGLTLPQFTAQNP